MQDITQFNNPLFEVGCHSCHPRYHIIPAGFKYEILADVEGILLHHIKNGEQLIMIVENNEVKRKVEVLIGMLFNINNQSQLVLDNMYNLQSGIADCIKFIIGFKGITIGDMSVSIESEQDDCYKIIIKSSSIQEKRIRKLKPKIHQIKHNNSEFEINQIANRNSWSIKIGNIIYLVNPSCHLNSHLKRIRKTILTRTGLETVLGLIDIQGQLASQIHILSTPELYIQTILLLSLVLNVNQQILSNIFIQQTITVNTTINEGHDLIFTFSEIVGLRHELSVAVYYKNTSLKIYADWYYDSKVFYFAHKKNLLTEKRYHEIIQPAFMESLCIVDTRGVNLQIESNKIFTQSTNMRYLNEGCQPLSEIIIKTAAQPQPINNLKCISQVKLLKDHLDLATILQINAMCDREQFTQNQLLLKKGMKCNKIYIVLKGILLIDYETSMKKYQHFKEADLIGLHLLFGRSVNKYSVKCITNCIVLSIQRQHLLTHIDSLVIQSIKKQQLIDLDSFSQYKLFESVHVNDLRKIIYESRFIQLQSNSNVEDPINKIWVLLSGQIFINSQLIAQGYTIIGKQFYNQKPVRKIEVSLTAKILEISHVHSIKLLATKIECMR